MIRPMIVMTTSISTSVKPRSPSRRAERMLENWSRAIVIMALFPMSFRDLIDRQKRCHDRNDKTANDQTYDNDRSGPDDPHNTVEAALQFGVVKVGDAPRQHGKLSGVLPQTQGAHRHR